MKKALFFAVFLGVAMASCDKVEDVSRQTENEIHLKNMIPPSNCAPLEMNILAGTVTSHPSAGNFYLSNDNENLYLQFWAHRGYQTIVDNIDIAFYNVLPLTRPDVNGFNYHFTVQEGQQYFSATIPLSNIMIQDSESPINLACNESIFVLVHVDVLLDPDIFDLDNSVTPESAWVGNLGSDGLWWKWFSYAPCCYAMECDEETAWSNGGKYVAKGDWAMYSGYSGIAKTEILYAGQYMEAGMVYFTPAGSDVNINIILNEGWSLQDVSEPVKIQGYNVAPTVKPSPGLFNTYKGEDLMVTVAAFNYYGVHVDLQYCGR